MDCCFWLFINPEQFFAHLFDTSHRCWLCVVDIITFMFAYTVVMLDLCTSCQDCRTVMMPLQFAFRGLLLDGGSVIVMTWLFAATVVILEDVTRGQEVGIVMVMLLLVAVTVVMIKYSVSSQHCGFVVGTWITFGCWEGFRVMMVLLSLDKAYCLYGGDLMVMTLLFALTAVTAYMFFNYKYTSLYLW